MASFEWVKEKNVEEIPIRPPLKRMRGSITDKVDKLVSQGYLKPVYAKPVDDLMDPQSWAMVPYVPPVNSESVTGDDSLAGGRNFLPKPNAIRDCPPGMRIRGGRLIPTNRVAGKPQETKEPASAKPVNARPLGSTARNAKPVTARPLNVKPLNAKPGNMKLKGDAIITLLSDSESETENSTLPHRAAGHGKHRATYEEKGKAVKMGNPRSLPIFESTASELSSGDARTRVKFILRQFDNLRRQFLAEEEDRVKTAGTGTKRADLRASRILMDYRVNGQESIYGPVPGVEVGDHYYYRVELLLISLHRQLQAGIDYISAGKSRFRDKNGNPVPIAVSVCASGGYEDDKDEGDTLIYTGQGGNNYKADKRQVLDQELTRGNLALKNCHDLGLAVRVIRGNEYKKTQSHQTPSGKIYYYDGMYDVVDCYQEKGSAGFNVWKFKLVRKPNQGPLSSNLVLFKGKNLPPELKQRGQRIISEDLSRGQEHYKVRVVGCMDGDHVPDTFEYIVTLKWSPGLPKPSPPSPCSCTRECSRKSSCSCVQLNGDQPYNEDGALLRAKKLVYECGPHCRCWPDTKCINRVAQKGLRFDLEVFKTEGKGWGLRCSNFIPQGSFVCEYLGEIIHESDAEKRVANDEYMFDLKIPDSMERRFGDVSGVVKDARSSDQDEDDEDDSNCQKYTVDANRYGNLARFINHSCEPNLFVQCVLYDHHDHRFPHIMLFASEHICPYTELSYDYGYELNNIQVNGKIKVKNCYCGARKCRGRLY